MPNDINEYHVTDTYVHWSEKNPEDLKKELRKRYDAIFDAGLEKELDFLLTIAYSAGIQDAADEHAGEEL
jgi:tRNA A37 N6-isopentenylltransferase MiaA